MKHRAACILLALSFLSAALAAPPPVVDVHRLERIKAGWTVAEAAGDEKQGHMVVERSVWPSFYLHWMPPPGDPGQPLSPKEAEEIVRGLWTELPFDAPLAATPSDLTPHPGLALEGTRSGNQMRCQYLVWLCPESRRVVVADLNMRLSGTSAPGELMDLQRDMARSVRCHPGAPAKNFGRLGQVFEVPSSALAYEHSSDWVPIASFRRQEKFGEAEWGIQTERNTPEKGQHLALEGDPFRRLFVSWGPAYDFPMSFDVLKTRIEDHWRERAADMMFIEAGRVSNDVWIWDGAMRPGPMFARPYPPTRLHKFRAWMWRRGDRTWFAAADVGGVRFGRANPSLSFDAWSLKLEEMFQAIVQD